MQGRWQRSRRGQSEDLNRSRSILKVGVCKFLDAKADGKSVSTHVECQFPAGPLMGDITFTQKPNNTIDFVDRDKTYTATLYRCPNSALPNIRRVSAGNLPAATGSVLRWSGRRVRGSACSIRHRSRHAGRLVHAWAPSFAVTAKDKMATCKFGADDQNLTRQGARSAFMKKCMSNKDEPRGAPTVPGAPAQH